MQNLSDEIYSEFFKTTQHPQEEKHQVPNSFKSLSASTSSTAVTNSIHGAEVKLSYTQAGSSLLSHHVSLRANDLQVSPKTITIPEDNGDELHPPG